MVTIERIAAGGDGVGRVDGLAVFVPRTAPGDVVQVAYVTHARHGRGRVLQVLEPSSQRVEPSCVHYERDRCGGCQLQHLSDAAQRDARRHIVQETLARIGRRDVPLPALEFGESWGYRGRLTLALRRRGGGWFGGLRPFDDPARVFALETCRIAHPLLVDVWQHLASVLRRADIALPAANDRSGVSDSGSLRLSLRLEPPLIEGGEPTVAVVIEGGSVWPEQVTWTSALRDADPRVSGVWWTPVPVAGERGTGRESAKVAPAAGVGNEYAPQAQEALAFAQVNERVAEGLRDHVFAAVTGFRPTRVVDGYAGTGRLAERLVAHGIATVAVEADPSGAEVAAQRIARAAGAVSPVAPGARARVVCDLMERALPSLTDPVDVVVVNPPRRGVHPDVTVWLEAPAQQRVRGLVYVSCDPATLARDLSRLPSWRVDSVQCFDMFPQTAHVETVCVLRRES